jgi:hypothetical protein
MVAGKLGLSQLKPLPALEKRLRFRVAGANKR